MAMNWAEKIKEAMKTKENRITFGADPEFFIVNKQNNLIPSWELGINGGKGFPELLPVTDDYKSINDVGILCDGVAVELNLPPEPALINIKAKLIDSLSFLQTQYPGIADRKAKVSNLDTIEVPKKYRSHALFTEIGCTPDLDAYSESGTRPAFCADDLGEIRFAGGHIHIGIDPWPEWMPKDVFIKFLDVIYLRNFISQTPVEKLRTRRADFYGKPGIWRETTYGIEYRTPNNGWLWWRNSTVSIIERAIRNILEPVNSSTETGLIKIYNNGLTEDIQNNFKLYSEGKVDPLFRFVNDAYGQMMSSFDGKKIYVEPRQITLESYKREVEGQKEIEIELEEAPLQEHGRIVFGREMMEIRARRVAEERVEIRDRDRVVWATPPVNSRWGIDEGGWVPRIILDWYREQDIPFPEQITYIGASTLIEHVVDIMFYTDEGSRTFVMTRLNPPDLFQIIEHEGQRFPVIDNNAVINAYENRGGWGEGNNAVEPYQPEVDEDQREAP